MAASLLISNRPVALVTNRAADATNSAPLPSLPQPQNITIPYFITISNSGPTVVSSNANGYAVVYTQAINRGPLFWPALGTALALILLVIWLSVRKRHAQ